MAKAKRYRPAMKSFKLAALLLALVIGLSACKPSTAPSSSSNGEGSSTPSSGTEITDEEYQEMLKKLAEAPDAADVELYGLTSDELLIYNPLSREAEKTGVINKYKDAEKVTGTLELGGMTLKYSMPKAVTAYDLLPIDYELTAAENTRYPVHIEANAFEDMSKSEGKNYYDMSLPGTLDISWEYLGYVTGTFKDAADRNKLTADNTDTPAEAYPNYDVTELTKSGTVQAGDIVWFRFKFTNTGNTIIDPEGCGGIMFAPHLVDKSGKVKNRQPYNQYYRIYDYIYPGESKEIWISFGRNLEENSFSFQMDPGEYTMHLQTVFRNNQDEKDWNSTIWAGRPMCDSTFDFTVAENAAQTTPSPVVSVNRTEDARKNGWLGKYEEFMTAFDTIKSSERTKEKGTLYLQVAPWTDNVSIKLITSGKGNIQSVNVPVNVESDSIKIEFNPDNKNFTIVDGKKEPLFITQIMSDMRANVQVTPYPESYIVEDIQEMRSYGANYFSTTAMPWMFESLGGQNYTPGATDKFNAFGDSYRYALDVVRKLGLQIEGMMTYPINRGNYGAIAGFITGKAFLTQFTPEGRIPTTDKNLAPINYELANYYFSRWGDLYYQYPTTGITPVSTEDTRGWMRVDINIRYQDGTIAGAQFAKWCKEKYGSIEAINEAWGTSFEKLTDIIPEKYGSDSSIHKIEYLDKNSPFHDYNKAMSDWDVYRTLVRVQNYEDILAGIENIPNPKIAIRTEGGNWLVSGIPSDTTNQHYRHVYYSQRRCGMIAEIVQASGTVVSHSDYITLPYQPSEVRELTELSIEQGINPMYLPTFNKMRDIAVNEKYGDDYTTHYNLETKSKGAVIHTLTASFPWFKAVYEAGGTPGIMWEDFECDGIVGETQKKELRFYQEKLKEALETEEGRKWCEDLSDVVSTNDWRNNSLKKYSYSDVFVQNQIDKANS